MSKDGEQLYTENPIEKEKKKGALVSSRRIHGEGAESWIVTVGSLRNRYQIYVYIYIRVIFEGRDEYLCGGAGRDGRWRARERKDKRNRLVSGGGVAAAAGFRGGPGFVTGGRKRSRPLITQLKWTGNHGSPVDVGLDAMATRRVDSVTIIVVLLMPLQVLLFSGGGGRGDPPRCPWNSYYNEIVLFGGVKLVGRGGEISYFFLFVTFFRKYSIYKTNLRHEYLFNCSK